MLVLSQDAHILVLMVFGGLCADRPSCGDREPEAMAWLNSYSCVLLLQHHGRLQVQTRGTLVCW